MIFFCARTVMVFVLTSCPRGKLLATTLAALNFTQWEVPSCSTAQAMAVAPWASPLVADERDTHHDSHDHGRHKGPLLSTTIRVPSYSLPWELRLPARGTDYGHSRQYQDLEQSGASGIHRLHLIQAPSTFRYILHFSLIHRAFVTETKV